MKVLFIYHCGLSQDAKAFYREYVKQGVDLAVIVPSKIVLNLAYDSGYFYSSKENESGYKFFSVDLRKPQCYGEGFKFFQLFKHFAGNKSLNPKRRPRRRVLELNEAVESCAPFLGFSFYRRARHRKAFF